MIAITHAWTKDLDEIPMFNKLNEELVLTLREPSEVDGMKTQYLLVEMFRMRLLMGINDSDISTFSNVFLPLNGLIDSHAPNITRMFKEQPDTKALATENDGIYMGYLL